MTKGRQILVSWPDDQPSGLDVSPNWIGYVPRKRNWGRRSHPNYTFRRHTCPSMAF